MSLLPCHHRSKHLTDLVSPCTPRTSRSTLACSAAAVLVLLRREPPHQPGVHSSGSLSRRAVPRLAAWRLPDPDNDQIALQRGPHCFNCTGRLLGLTKFGKLGSPLDGPEPCKGSLRCGCREEMACCFCPVASSSAIRSWSSSRAMVTWLSFLRLLTQSPPVLVRPLLLHSQNRAGPCPARVRALVIFVGVGLGHDEAARTPLRLALSPCCPSKVEYRDEEQTTEQGTVRSVSQRIETSGSQFSHPSTFTEMGASCWVNDVRHNHNFYCGKLWLHVPNLANILVHLLTTYIAATPAARCTREGQPTSLRGLENSQEQPIHTGFELPC